MLKRQNIHKVSPYAHTPTSDVSTMISDIGRSIGSCNVGFVIQKVGPGKHSSRKHKHVFQEELLIVMRGVGILHHGSEAIECGPGDCFCYLPVDEEAHCFENTGTEELEIWAIGDRVPHEVCIYPEQNIAFVEGLGADVPLEKIIPSKWTEATRPK